VPLQLPEYQCHEAPVPNEPPVTNKVLEFPGHIEAGFAEAPVGAVDEVLTVIVTVAHVVLLQVPSALT
jgi:hypothetical protein